jgi:hypothetical protein
MVTKHGVKVVHNAINVVAMTPIVFAPTMFSNLMFAPTGASQRHQHRRTHFFPLHN